MVGKIDGSLPMDDTLIDEAVLLRLQEWGVEYEMSYSDHGRGWARHVDNHLRLG